MVLDAGGAHRSCCETAIARVVFLFPSLGGCASNKFGLSDYLIVFMFIYKL